MNTTRTATAQEAGVADAARPDVDRRAVVRALSSEVSRVTGAGADTADVQAARLADLAAHYGAHPFTPLEQSRARLGLDRAEFAHLLDMFGRIPDLGTAVEHGPAGKYWSNTIKPLDAAGALDAAVYRKPAFPYSVGLYPGPTCMFRCHFCVRVTGARYEAASVPTGNETLAAIIDEVPTDNPKAMYMSGGLEPLTNPGLGELVSHAAGRGFDLTVYTNAFALTEQTLNRQPGLWELGAIRTSLYGLNNDEYETTTGKRGAFERVKKNLQGFLRMRAERQAPIRLGFNHIILPGRADRLTDLVDFIAELNESSPQRPLDFVTVREDYSGRDDGRLSESERTELREGLVRFVDYAAERTPGMHIDLGYALESLRRGVDAELLRIRPETMRPTAHPQVAVQIDLLGDVYLYREAGFPELEGATRYIAGRVTPSTSLREVVENFVLENEGVQPRPGDEYFLDGFDQSVTARLNQLERDIADGWEDHRGFLRGR
ncbi:dTDP-4-amino-4,6-dideoxy-D-glucose ammonia-lyase [Saccharopolyspora erythraea]|uniref:dTDP-4-amino-4,6-dideoxy-D-glucose ammonia-lyase n=1 Tax=Saccharopolyspora erythraea TaxID=1836 RepID=UPI001BA95741|nr:dTDP-4-amino-4,6-dideoxy-D-glucose ammonia-lyase [Saccharopolyspora erythraea]QUH00046.1 dTDP-4-amino-4,6-dideoxy-D-glucose ammonia-lyase [Saccharopolyspora erythraea]